MGNVIDKCTGNERGRRKINLLLVGLDNAGKTKTANNLTGQSDREVLPTVGFRAYNLVHRRYPVVIYDLGGGPGFRRIWEQYYSDVHGVIFVVDSTDLSRLDECREVLKAVLSHEKISGKPMLILANKQDKQGALDDVDLVERLDIESVVNRYRCPTRVEAYTAATPESKDKRKEKMDPGLLKGYSWLLNYVIHRYGDLNLRVQTDINTEKTRRQMFKPKEVAAGADKMPSSFENPNYTGKAEVDGDTSRPPPDGVIMVKEAVSNKSIDYDAIEVANIEDVDDKNNEKMASLFGDKLDDSVEQKPIELEARTHVRKLSPIVRGRFTVTAHGGDTVRPQTSPSIVMKNESIGDNSNVGQIVSPEKLSLSAVNRTNNSGRVTDIGLVQPVTGPTVGPLSARRQVLPPIGQTDSNNIVSVTASPLSLGDSDSITPIIQQKQVASPPLVKSPAKGDDVKWSSQEDSEIENDHSKGDRRPRSATQNVREQLEKTKDSFKNRLSLKSLKRNRTSPEINSSLFSYDPATPSKNYDNNHQQAEGGEFSAKTKNYGRVGLRSDTVM